MKTTAKCWIEALKSFMICLSSSCVFISSWVRRLKDGPVDLQFGGKDGMETKDGKRLKERD